MSEFKETLDAIEAKIKQRFEEVGNSVDEKVSVEEFAKKSAELDEMKEEQKKLKLMLITKAANGPEVKSEGDKRVEEFLRKSECADAIELKTIYTGDDSNAGYTVMPELQVMIDAYVQELSPFSANAEHISTGSDSIERLANYTETTNSSWGNELDSGDAETDLNLKKQKIYAHDIYTKAFISRNMLNDSSANVEGMVAEQVGWSFTNKSNTAFFSGDGVGKPKGFLLDSNIETSNSGAATGLTADGIFDLVSLLKQAYLTGATFVMNRDTFYKHLLTLDDGELRKYLQPDLRANVSFTLLGYPILIDPNMPNVEAGAESIMFGNIRQGYTVLDRQGIEIEVDRVTQYPLVKYNFHQRIGGDVRVAEAMKLMTIAAN